MDITELKAMLRSLVEMELRQTQHDARSLLRCYHAMTGKRLPLAKHGYNDPVLFLREIFNDCFEFHGPEDNPVITLKLTTNVRFKEQRRSIPDHHQSVSDSAEENASMDRAELNELKTKLRDLVDELHPEGVWCSDLMVLYRQRYRQELDFKRFGYPDIEALALELDWHHEFRAKRWRLKVRRLLSVECARPPTPPFDPDDALPGIPYDRSVFPEDCMGMTEVIPSEPLDSLVSGASVRVVVGEVYSPSHFWLQRLGEQFQETLSEMMDDMTDYYRFGQGKGRVLAVGAVCVGHYCSSVFEGYWHRSVIVRVLDSDTVKVRLIDYGNVMSVSVDDLKPLRREFAALPAQAVRARLAGVRPAGGSLCWSHATSAYFHRLAYDKRFVAHIIAVDRDEAILEVFLMDTSADKDVCISKQLLSVGHADSRPDAATQRSDLYLFPQFAALESGATPNFCEIQTCLRDGIMLDYVEDYRRHVPACRPLHERPEAATSNESSPSPDEQPETSSASRALCDHPRARPIGPRDPRNGPCPRCCDPRLDQRAPFDPPRDPYNAPSPRAPSAPPRMRPLVPRNVRSASSPRPPILHPPRYRRKGSLEPYNATSPHCDGLSVDPWAPCDSPRGRPMSPRESRNAPSQLCDVPLVPRVALRSPRNAPSTRFNTPRVSQGDPRNAPRTRCDASRAPRADLLASQGAVPRHRPLDPNLSMRSSSSPPESTSCGRPPASEARPIPPSPPPFREALRAQYNAPNPRCDAPRVPRAELLASQGAVPRYRPPGLNQLMRSSGSPPESASSSDSSASEARPPPPSPPPFREALRAACNAPTPRSDVPRTPRAELLASQGAVSRHWPLDPNLSMHSSSSPPESTSYGEPPASEARSTSLSPPPFREALRTPYNAPNPRCDAPRVPRTEPLAPPSAVPRYQPPGLNRSMRLSGSLPEPTSCSFSLDSVTRPTLPSLNPSDEVPARSPPPTYGASVGLGASVLLPMVDCEIFQLLGMVNVSAARWYMSNAISRAMPTGQTSALPTASTLNLAPPTSTPNLAPPAFMPNVAMPASTLNVEAPEYQPAGERPPPAPF